MKKLPSLFGLFFSSTILFAQQKNYTITISSIPSQHKVIVKANDQPFTELIYPDTLEKPVLYPIYAPDGQIITRGFPIAPRTGEPTDHPHHIGLWMNYENVNGLDFWNNSFAIPSDKKNMYGWIRTNGIAQTKNGDKGILEYNADWVDQQKNILLKETTTFIFSANAEERIIDRITKLTAQKDILFKDAKDGFLGLRVAHELELPSKDARQFVDDKGNITKIAANNNSGVTGNYLTSEGKTGDSTWSTKAKWCMLYGKIKEDTISIVIIDNPQNPGYPTYWHARGYGLFAANPLGQKIFSNGKQELNFSLKKGNSITFRYRIVIASGKERLLAIEVERLSKEFEK
ncbi:MAG TPA: PmoA family protein [Puia sp.]